MPWPPLRDRSSGDPGQLSTGRIFVDRFDKPVRSAIRRKAKQSFVDLFLGEMANLPCVHGKQPFAENATQGVGAPAFEFNKDLGRRIGCEGRSLSKLRRAEIMLFRQFPSGPRLTDCTLFGSFPEPDRHPAASAKPFEFLPHRDFRSNGHYFPHI